MPALDALTVLAPLAVWGVWGLMQRGRAPARLRSSSPRGAARDSEWGAPADGREADRAELSAMGKGRGLGMTYQTGRVCPPRPAGRPNPQQESPRPQRL